MKKRFLMPVILFSFTACTTQYPITTETPRNNQTYSVQYLFEHDGCRVYRFYDKGQWVYFTNCKGETISYPDSTKVIRNSTNMKSKN